MQPAATFTATAVLFAGAWYALLGSLGQLAALGYLYPISVAAYVHSLIWHIRRQMVVPFGRAAVQANKDLVSGLRGVAYFGAVLGPGVFTEMATPLVWAGVAFAATAGPLSALCYGIGFGLGRSATVLAAIPLGPRIADYGRVTEFVVITLPGRLRPVGIFTAACGACIITLNALLP